MLSVLTIVLACTPNPTLVCTTREYNPVCADNTDFSNECLAEAAGYTKECANKLTPGPCGGSLFTMPMCMQHEVFSETGKCVPRPWSDFKSCQEEKKQGACPNGYDPNPWVEAHCPLTCKS